MNLLKSMLPSLCVFGGLLGIYGCATTPPLPEAYSAKFTPRFSAGEIQKDSPAHITFALVEPGYQRGYIHSYRSQSLGNGRTQWLMSPEEHPTSKLFRESLKKELEALMISKGYRVAGPYNNLYEMTFPQKKQADLTLQPVITFVLEAPQLNCHAVTSLAGAMLGLQNDSSECEASGSCAIQGRVDFEVLEPLTAQKMWTKSVNIDSASEDCSAKSPDGYKAVYDNAVAKLLDGAYNATIGKIDTYFNREEMELVKQQSLELRPKSQ